MVEWITRDGNFSFKKSAKTALIMFWSVSNSEFVYPWVCAHITIILLQVNLSTAALVFIFFLVLNLWTKVFISDWEKIFAGTLLRQTRHAARDENRTGRMMLMEDAEETCQPGLGSPWARDCIHDNAKWHLWQRSKA